MFCDDNKCECVGRGREIFLCSLKREPGYSKYFGFGAKKKGEQEKNGRTPNGQ
jgi:hypothetical protein